MIKEMKIQHLFKYLIVLFLLILVSMCATKHWKLSGDPPTRLEPVQTPTPNIIKTSITLPPLNDQIPSFFRKCVLARATPSPRLTSSPSHIPTENPNK